MFEAQATSNRVYNSDMLIPVKKTIPKDVLLGGRMLRINVFYLCSLGVTFEALRNLRAETKYSDAAGLLNSAELQIDQLLNNSPYRFKTSWRAGNEFLNVIRGHKNRAESQFGSSPVGEEELGWAATQIATAVNQYMPLLAAEMEVADAYLVLPKGGFDTTQLVEHGISIFPSELATKVPEAVEDCKAAARCIAFELPTAAGFHLHRANEAVLRRYYDAVTGDAGRPTGRSIQAYLSSMEDRGVGDPKVLSSLADLKDLHRNPVLHPEDNIESVEKALALHGIICSVMVHMLEKIERPLM